MISDRAVEKSQDELACNAARPQPVSLWRYSAALVFVAAVIANACSYADIDLWGHVYFGEAMIRAGRIIAHDPYNYSVPGHLWLHHEWLTEVMMAAIYQHCGIVGLKLWHFSVTAFAIVMLSMAEGETGAPPPIQFGVLAAAAVTLSAVMQFRPQIFTYALFAMLIFLLTRELYGRRSHLWLVIPMLALWSNLHGGFFIGLVTLGIYTAVIGVDDLLSGRGLERAWRLAALTLAAAAATFVNPIGIECWRTVFVSLTDPLAHKVMADWRPIVTVVRESGAHGSDNLLLELWAAYIVTLAISVAVTPRRDDWPLIAIAAVMTAAAFSAIRNIPLPVIAGAPLLARHLDLTFQKLLAKKGELANPEAQDTSSVQRMSIAGQSLIFIASFAVLFGRQGLLSAKLATVGEYPSGAVAFMKDRNLHGNILNPSQWGQYLIWHLAPESKIFYDSRFDTVYPQKVLIQYLDFFFGPPSGAKLLTEYPNDFVLVITNSTAYRTMLEQRSWRLLYRDSVCALFAPAGSRAAEMPGLPVIGKAKKVFFP
ncbi:hypothetical protein IMX07_13545 [bacterium]|nr:hypothetical protein [bacterium]